MNLKRHYDTLWKESLQTFKRNKFKFDPQIDSASDTRFGITLLARPSKEVKQEISKTLKEINAVAPNQYYYPDSDLHITTLSIISCYQGFSLKSIKPTEYCSLIQSAVDYVSPFHIRFRGLTASPSCILIQGFPENNQLNRLRNRLRDNFNQSGLEHSIDKRYKLQTAHITAIRFKEPFSDADKFVKTISNFRNKDFGSCLVDQLELVVNDWYHKKDKVTELHTFPLST